MKILFKYLEVHDLLLVVPELLHGFPNPLRLLFYLHIPPLLNICKHLEILFLAIWRETPLKIMIKNGSKIMITELQMRHK